MQPKREVFNERDLTYRYMPRDNGTADVFIYKFIEEIHNEAEEGCTPSFLYEFNEFNVNMDEITEEMIAENPLDYLDYSAETESITLEERVSAMEEAIVDLVGVIMSD